MQSMTVWFEIPVLDMDRAKKFYEEVFEIEIHVGEMGDSTLGFFPRDGWANSGVLALHPNKKPTTDGVLIYFNAGEDMTPVQARVEQAGGKMMMTKCEIGGDNGYMALFVDTEGNQLGLWSPK